MKRLVVVLAVLALLMAGCSSTEPQAIAVAGSGDGDALVSYGKVINAQAEIGITGVGFNGPEKTDYAVGPYGMYLIPMTEEIADDWQPFAGGAMLIDQDFEFIPKVVAGVIYKPHDTLSPCYLAERAFPTGSVDSVNIRGRSDDIYHWFGIRYRW